ncbi:hypothetical protein IIA15_03950 [candidate division TA06 bacterium]|nr:hypothetical protein [candidate division TA06 bacterium]
MIPHILPFLLISLVDPLLLPYGMRGDLYSKGEGVIYGGGVTLLHYSYGLSDRWNHNMGLSIIPPGFYVGSKIGVLSKDKRNISIGVNYLKGSFEFFDEYYYYSLSQIFLASTLKVGKEEFTLTPILYLNGGLHPSLFFAYHRELGGIQFYLEGISFPEFSPGLLLVAAGPPQRKKFRVDMGPVFLIGEGGVGIGPYVRLGYRF